MENNYPKLDDTLCQEHLKDKTMYCEKELIWFCEFCLKNHKQCGFPLHFTEIIEKYTDNEKSGNDNENYVKTIDQVIKFKNDVNDHIEEFVLFLRDTNDNNIDLHNKNKIQLAIQIQKYLQNNNKSKIKEVIEKFYEDLKGSVENLGKVMKINNLPSANLIINDNLIFTQDHLSYLKIWLNKVNLKVELVFKASKDGYKADNFHQKCSNIPNNLTVIKTRHGTIIGGYTPLPWRRGTSDYEYQDDPSRSTFLFSLTKGMQYQLRETDRYAISYSQKWGPKFGGGHDLEIIDDCNVNPSTYSAIGFSYNYIGSKSDFYGVDDKYFIDDYEFYKVILN